MAAIPPISHRKQSPIEQHEPRARERYLVKSKPAKGNPSPNKEHDGVDRMKCSIYFNTDVPGLQDVPKHHLQLGVGSDSQSNREIGFAWRNGTKEKKDLHS